MTPLEQERLRQEAQKKFAAQQSPWLGKLDSFINELRNPAQETYRQFTANLANQLPTDYSQTMASTDPTANITAPEVPLMMRSVEANTPAGDPEYTTMQRGPAATSSAALNKIASTPTFSSGPSAPSLQAQLEEGYKSMMNQREGNLGRLQEIQGIIAAQPAGMDLSPLLAYIDSETGSNLSKGYKGPEDSVNKVMQLERAIAQEQRGITQDEISLLKMRADSDYKSKLLAGRAGKTGRLSQNMIKNLNEGRAIPKMLRNISSLIQSNSSLFGPAMGRLASANPYDTKVQTINAEMKAKSQAFGRYMEGGVLRKEDEKKYRDMFPKISDTPEVAQNKLRIVENLLKERHNSDLEAFAAQGFDITGLELEKKKQSPAENEEALAWAQANPNDPRAARVLAKLGVK